MIVSSCTVVIVDDDSSVRRSLRRLLVAAGYDVVVCSSAEELLAIDALPVPSCLIIDVSMPGMTGLDLHDVLRGIGSTVPVILMSGQSSAAIGARALTSGAVALLTKPFDEESLLRVLGQAVPHTSMLPPTRS